MNIKYQTRAVGLILFFAVIGNFPGLAQAGPKPVTTEPIAPSEKAPVRYSPLTSNSQVWLSQRLTATDGVALDTFGPSVGISGSTAVVGSPCSMVDGNPCQGAAYVFSFSNGAWSQAQKLTANDGQTFDEFGKTVAIDGDTIVVGIYSATNPWGKVYIFSKINGSWEQTQELLPSLYGGNGFGSTLAIDENQLLVGFPFAYVNGKPYQGCVFAYNKVNGSWNQTQIMTASDGAANDEYGFSLGLSGSNALIGAELATIGGNAHKGAVYAYQLSNGSWIQTQKITAADEQLQSDFGRSTAVSGNTAVISSYGMDSLGAIYFFTLSGGVWAQNQEIANPNPEHSLGGFGVSVDLSGSLAFIGDDTGYTSSQGQGLAYLYKNTNGV